MNRGNTITRGELLDIRVHGEPLVAMRTINRWIERGILKPLRDPRTGRPFRPHRYSAKRALALAKRALANRKRFRPDLDGEE